MNQTEPMGSNGEAQLSPSRRPNRGLTLLLFVIVLAVVAYFLGRSIVGQWSTIRTYPWHLHVGWLACSAVVIWLDFSLFVHLWRTLLQAVSRKRLGFLTAFRISVLANFGKYIPGKVWSVLGMVMLLKREGYAASTALAATVLHQAYTVVSGLIFVAVVLGNEVFGGKPLVPVFVGVVAGAIILYPPVFTVMLNFGLRLAKREQITIKLSFPMAVKLFLVYIVAWIFYGAAFWCLLRGLGIQPESFWRTGASFCAAYLLGFLALFAPGGLGVREGVVTVLLGSSLAPGLPALIAVAARLWMTMIELSQLAFAILTGRKKILDRSSDQ